jgi:hypothetical protein
VFAAIILLLLAGIVLVYPRRDAQSVRDAPLTIRFVVKDGQSGKPVVGAHIALSDELDHATILRTDKDGLATLATDRNPLRQDHTIPVFASYRPLPYRRWLVVLTAEGYRPPEPWPISSAEYNLTKVGDSYELMVPVSLVLQAEAP